MQDVPQRKPFRAARHLLTASLLALACAGHAGERLHRLDIPSQDLASALKYYGSAVGEQVLFSEEIVRGRHSVPLSGEYTADGALRRMLEGSDLHVDRTPSGVLLIRAAGSGNGAGTPSPREVGGHGPALELDTVRVTARKRSESIMDVPMNISVISSTELNERNIANVQDIYRTIAGGSSPTGALILRGLVGGNTASPRTTSQFVDGIPFGFGDVFDIDQVEVLRGPQGTLWGSNAIGGTVQIQTRQPQFNALELFSTIVGEKERNLSGLRTRTQAGINLPLIDDTLALRLAASTSQTPGKYVNAYTGHAARSDNEFIRTQLRWQPREGLDVNLGHIWVSGRRSGHTQADRSIPGYYWVPKLSPNPDSPWGYDVDFDTVDCAPDAERASCSLYGRGPGSDSKYTVYSLMDEWSRDSTNLFSLRADLDNLFDIASVHYVGSYRKTSGKGLFDWSRLDTDDMARTWGMNDRGNQRTTHELRFQNLERVGGFDWTVGFFQDRNWTGYTPGAQFQNYDKDPRSMAIFSAWNEFALEGFAGMGISNIAQLGQALYGNPDIIYDWTILRSHARERAAFGELSYLLETGVGKFEITAGLRRFSFEDFSASQLSGIWYAPGPDGNPYVDEVLGGKETGSRKKFSVSWMPNDQLNVYALYSEGYRPGGNNEFLPSGCLGDEFAGAYQIRYQSDQIENYELGFKAALFDRRLRVSSAVYNIDWSDTWASVNMPSCGFSYLTNTPGKSANSRGLEFESSLHLTDTTQLTFNYGYTDSTLTMDNPALQAKAGDDMTMVPSYNAYLAVDQAFRWLGRQAFARLDVASYGEYKSHFNTHPRDVAPSYTTVNLSGRMHLNDSTVLSLYATNLFNKDYITYRSVVVRNAAGNINTRNGLFETYGGERGIGVRLDYAF